MKRSKSWATGALVLLLVAGCTGDNDPTTNPSATPTTTSTAPEPVELRLAVYGDDATLQMYQDIADAFTVEHPEVTFELTSTADASAAAEAAIGAISAGVGAPDVFLLGVEHLADVVEADAVTPVNELMEARDIPFGDGIQRNGLTAFSANAALACMPNEVSPLVAYYNTRLVRPRQLLDEDGERLLSLDKGWTWEMFMAAAAQAKSRGAADGAKGGWLAPDLDALTPFILSAGGSVVDQELGPKHLTLSDGSTRAALKTLATFTRDPSLSLTPTEALRRSPLQWFRSGRLGVLFSTRAVLPSLRAVKDLKFNVAQLPKIDSAETTATMNAYCIAGTSEHVETAADFIAFAVDGPGVEISAVTGATVPVSLDILHMPVFLQPLQQPSNGQAFAESARRASLPPYSTRWSAARAAADPVLTRILYGRGINVTDEETPVLDALLEQTDEESRAIFEPPKPSPTETP
ncbi:MAG TPA: extracellular solute-binding protein [Nocardioidaceae bacterium]|nr:extracellular solute-binding protein [Nocardioidaceae bacterium]